MRDFFSYKDGENVVHYTCNAPSSRTSKGIKDIGENFGIGPSEVLLIPIKLFAKAGILIAGISKEVLTIVSETLLAKMK